MTQVKISTHLRGETQGKKKIPYHSLLEQHVRPDSYLLMITTETK